MRRNSSKSKRSTSGGVFRYGRRSGAGSKKTNRSNSLPGGSLRRSPPRRLEPAEGGAFPADSAADVPSTVTSSENGNSVRSDVATKVADQSVAVISPVASSENGNSIGNYVATRAADQSVSVISPVASSEGGNSIKNDVETRAADQSVAVVSYQSNEVADTRPINRKSVLEPVKEDSPAKSTDAPVNAGGWVGIGFDGEALALSVCSGSSSVDHSSLRERSVPNAIDFKRSELENLPIVEEDETSVVNHDEFLHSRLLASRVLQDVEDLSVDLSVLEDIDSISSVMTREDAIDLAKRLEKMERQLLELAGETGKVDALRALAKATHNQKKQAELLQRKLRKQERKINTLNDLCQRLLDRKQQDHAMRPATQNDIDSLKNSNDELTLELLRSESRNEELSERMRQLKEENALQNASLHSYRRSEKKGVDKMRAKFNKLLEDSDRRAAKDKATIEKLESEITAMAVAHARSEKRSQSKIEILTEIKAAMEEQIQLLVKDDSSTE